MWCLIAWRRVDQLASKVKYESPRLTYGFNISIARLMHNSTRIPCNVPLFISSENRLPSIALDPPTSENKKLQGDCDYDKGNLKIIHYTSFSLGSWN